VKYQFFSQILALCRARIITNPTIHMASLHSITPMCMVRIVIIQARHSAKIRAKSVIVSEKLFQSSHTVKMDIGHPVSESKFRTLVKVNLGRRTSR
jgi:hypothetical protein